MHTLTRIQKKYGYDKFDEFPLNGAVLWVNTFIQLFLNIVVEFFATSSIFVWAIGYLLFPFNSESEKFTERLLDYIVFSFSFNLAIWFVGVPILIVNTTFTGLLTEEVNDYMSWFPKE